MIGREITEIVIHCTGTAGDVSAAEVDEYHKSLGWDGIGYHFLVRTDGTVERGRPVEQQGAHVYRHNATTIGVAYAGGLKDDSRTPAQKLALRALLLKLTYDYPNSKIMGHRDYPGVVKKCPQFDAITEYADLQPNN